MRDSDRTAGGGRGAPDLCRRSGPGGTSASRVVTLLVLTALAPVPDLAAQTELRPLGRLELLVRGVGARPDPVNPTVPRNIASGVRLVVSDGSSDLSAAEAERFLGTGFQIRAELSGPGLPQTVSLPDPSVAQGDDPLLLGLPPLAVSGRYELSSLRIVDATGRPLLDASPSSIEIEVIEQILVTSVKTRALSLDEIRERGIVLDSDDFLGFEFTLGLRLESEVVDLSFPVVFDRDGVAVPPVLTPPPAPRRAGVAPPPTIVPMLLEAQPLNDDGSPGEKIPLTLPSGEPVRIPSVLVIPGNVGFLKQFFSAQLFVANGAPVGSGLVVRDITGTVEMPPGADQVAGTADDPLALPELQRDGVVILQPETLPVLGIGPDGQPGTPDDTDSFQPGQQGQAEFLIRGEREGFHTLDFDIAAVLEGLPVGPVAITGQASGGVLVRNPFFDMTFTVPSVIRKDEEFDLFVTVTNIGKGDGNLVTVGLDASRLSGATLLSDPTHEIETLPPGESVTLPWRFRGQRTGQVVATYLKFDPDAGAKGRLDFTLAVGERGVPLSPDTLVLPASVDAVPRSVVDAAMRVLGQAWSVANAPPGTLPASVTRIPTEVVVAKALALAEAGLRIELGQPLNAALRDLLFDYHAAAEVDPGFDQLLRQTSAGRGLAAAIGAALRAPSLGGDALAGGLVDWESDVADVAASGHDLAFFAVGDTPGAPVQVRVTGPAGGTLDAASAGVPGAVLVPLGTAPDAPVFGLLGIPPTSPWTLEVLGTGDGVFDLAFSVPRGDGRLVHARRANVPVAAGSRARIQIDPVRPQRVSLEQDLDGDGVFEDELMLSLSTLSPAGPRLVSANVIGPETLDGASPYGIQAAFLFDRIVDPATAADVNNYALDQNEVRAAKQQLSGRLVFASLDQPEGPYLPQTLSVSGMADGRGEIGPSASVPLTSRLLDPGAIVSGRVLDALGQPVPGSLVTYAVTRTWNTCQPISLERSGLAQRRVDSQGRYEFRYVRQDQCGGPFVLFTTDPATGARREVRRFVRTAGEPIVMDIVLSGRGNVAGTVRDLSGAGVPAAAVTVLSLEDSQSGGTAMTDGDGRYIVYGVSVGGVSVRAAKGLGVGRGSGRIDRAGTTTTIDLTLDSGAVDFSGTVYKLEGGIQTVIPDIVVTFEIRDGFFFQTVGYAVSDAAGRFAITGMPAGRFRVTAALNTRDRIVLEGDANAGDVFANQNLVIEVPDPSELATVTGSVRFPGGQPAPDVVVSLGASAATTDALGGFVLPGIEVKPGVSQRVLARTRDGLRSGSTTVLVGAPGVVGGADIELSGIGSVIFTVLDPQGNARSGQEVRLLTGCADICGCLPRQTNALGQVRYDGVAIGTFRAQAIDLASSVVDVARGSATVTQDGQVASGVLRFPGTGTVRGIVRDPDGEPLFGADVSLLSPLFVNDGINVCGLTSRVSHQGRTDQEGLFEFTRVNLGSVKVTASQAFFPSQVGGQGVLSFDGDVKSFDLKLLSTVSGELSGVVYLPDGVTLAGAGVEITANGPLPDVTVTTNAAGAYRFAKIFPEGGYTVTIRDPVTGGLAQERIYLRTDEAAVHDFRLEGRGTVLVRVVDGAGDPVERAFVSLRETEFPGRSFDGSVDPSNAGELEFPGIFEGPLSVEASDPFGRGGRTSVELPGPGTTVPVTVRLTTTGRVEGRFLLPGTPPQPIPFGTVRLLSSGRVIGQVTTGSSQDDLGTFRFDYVPAGSIRLEAEDPLTGRTGLAVGTLQNEGQVLTLDVTAQGLGTVSGAVIGSSGNEPLAHVDIISGSYRACTFADGDGFYRVAGVPEGLVTVTASTPGGGLQGSASAPLTQDGQNLEIDVRLRDSGSISGVVVQSDDVTPAPASIVRIQVGGLGGGTQQTTTDANGAFSFDRVPSGLATLSVDVLGSIDEVRATAEVPAGGALTGVRLRLRGVGSVRGRTLDGTTAIPAYVTLDGEGYRYSFQTGASGEFFFPELLAGPVSGTLSANIGGFPLRGAAADAILPGQETLMDILVQETGSVIGRVLRSDGATPAFGANVTLRLVGSFGVPTVQVDENGLFQVDGIPLGTLEVSVDDPITGGVARLVGIPLTSAGQTVDLQDLVLDDTPIAVVSVDPPDGSVGVAIDQPIHVTFSDPLNAATLSAVGVLLDGVPLSVAYTLSPDGRTVTLSRAWYDSRDFVVQASTGVRDVYGRPLQQVFQSRFRTVDLSPPQVLSVQPAPGAIQVSSDASIAITFSEDVSGTPSLAAVVTLTGPAGPVPGTASLAGPDTVLFIPSTGLSLNSVYALSVTGAVDVSGNTQAVPFASTFATVDTVAPVLTVVQPTPAGWVSVKRPTISGTVQELLSGLDAASGGASIDGVAQVASFSPTVFSLVPAADLAEGAHSVSLSVNDRAGNTGGVVFGFSVDTVPPDPARVEGVADGAVVSGSLSLTAAADDAGSGVASIDVFRGAAKVATVVAPGFAATLNVSAWSEGEHLLTARARDVAGNLGDAAPAVRVVVDNDPLTVSLTAPAAGRRVRETVDASAVTSEPAQRVEFSAGGALEIDTQPPYAATLSLVGLPEGPVEVTATAYGLLGETASAVVGIEIDRTAPAAPDPAKVTAEQIDQGVSLVLGAAGAAEPGATLEVTNTANASVASAPVEATGTFGLNVPAVRDDVLELVAVDEAGNRSAVAQVVVEQSRAEGGIPLLGLQLWASADRDVVLDATGGVSSVGDRSDAANDLQQTQPDQRPTLVENEVNGLPVLRFDGVDDHLRFTTRLTTIRSVFWVLRESAAPAAGLRHLLGDRSGTYHFYGGSTNIYNTSSTHANVLNGQTWMNGVPVDGQQTPRPKELAVVSVVTAGDVTADNFSAYGGFLNQSWAGDLAELIVYDRALSGEERQSVEDYLVARYRPYTPNVGAPRIEPNGGEFEVAQVVTLRTPTPGAEIRYTLDGGDVTGTSTLYTGPLSLTGTATVRAKAFRVGFLPSQTAVATFTRTDVEFSPSALSGLQIWVHAGAGLPPAQAVDRWVDQSGQGNDLVQPRGSQQPLLVTDAANGFPVLRFDGVDDHMPFTTRLTNIRSVFWVLRESAAPAAGLRHLLGDRSGTYHFYGGPTNIYNTGSTHANVLNGQTWVNGVPVDGQQTPRPKDLAVVSVVTTGNVTADNFSAYATYLSQSWAGDLAELIVFDRPLGGEERQSVEDYLVAKYRPYTPPVGAPRIEPNGGEFAGTQVVTLRTPTAGAEIRYTLGGADVTPTSALYQGPLSLTGTTTLRAKAFRADFAPSPTAAARFTRTDVDFSPSAVPGLQLWVHAGAGLPPSQAVDLWADQSGQGNDLVQATGKEQPRLVPDAANGFPVLRFDGVDDHLRFTTRLTDIRSAFWVLRESASPTPGLRHLLGDRSGTYHFYGGSTNLYNTSSTHANVLNGQTWLNGVPVDGQLTPRPRSLSVVSVVTTGNVTADNFSAYSNFLNQSWAGDLAELILFDRPLDGPERGAIEAYLARKYGAGSLPVAAPRVAPNGGTFSAPFDVTLSTTTPGAEIRYTTDGTPPDATSTLYTAPFTIATTTTVKARAFLAGEAPSDVVTVGFIDAAGFTPDDVAGLRLWVRGDAGLELSAASVTAWRDQSGQATPNDLTQERGIWLPGWTPEAVAGLPALRLDGADDRLELAQRLTDIRTVFWVIREDPAATPNFRPALGDASTYAFHGGTTTLWGSSAAPNVRNGDLYVNGSDVVTDGLVTDRPQVMTILALVTAGNVAAGNVANDRNLADRSWQGELAELILYDRPLTPDERNDVEAYLNARYGIYLETP